MRLLGGAGAGERSEMIMAPGGCGVRAAAGRRENPSDSVLEMARGPFDFLLRLLPETTAASIDEQIMFGSRHQLQ